jgi:hypothetical protein
LFAVKVSRPTSLEPGENKVRSCFLFLFVASSLHYALRDPSQIERALTFLPCRYRYRTR